ncbi:unnamed protein product [Miscanthus lutarioriparius]|uniref:Uncharacterized protein n=1 Tax=Miscanthus lutarioriparius TaxID=422564 RepID=A0A811RXV9_9POAL|nr:unnamed protein product [Miscanthus lutarioriparius]
MAPHGPPFDFDLNEPPPPENDGVDGMSAGPVPEPSVQQDPLPPAPVPEPSAQQDPLPPPAPVPEPTTAHVPLPARSLAPAPEASPVDPLPAPLRAPVPVPVPVPSPHHHLPSPVLDLEAPLSSLDDEDEDEADLPPPPPLPLPPPPPPSWYRVDTSDAPTASSGRQGDAARQYSSPETWAPRCSRAATASDTTSSHRSRRRPYSCDDAISKQRRVDYDEDGGSSRFRSGSRRRSEFGSPRRYGRSGLPPPRHYYEQDGGRHAPAADGQPGAPAKNRRRRRRVQRRHHGYQYEGPVQKQQGFRGQERPRVHHGPHHGPEVPKVGYASYSPASPSFVRRDSSGARLSPEQERGTGWDRRQCREKDAPPFRPSSSSGPHGWDDPYHGRQSQAAQEPPKNGGYQHGDREAPSFRPLSTGAHGGRDDGSFGGRHIPPEEKTITGGAHHQQQTKAPHGLDEHFPDRAYHPYAHRGSGFDRPDDGGGRNPSRREPRDSYEHRRYSKQLRSGAPPARVLRRYYGDVQE